MTIAPARRRPSSKSDSRSAAADYRLEDQIGYVMRKAHQRATAIFMSHFGPHQLTPTQWTTLVRIHEQGSLSQNHLGRLTAMDPATTQGVVQRLIERKLIARTADPKDARRKLLTLSKSGQRLVEALVVKAFEVSRDTLAPLNETDKARLIDLLTRIG